MVKSVQTWAVPLAPKSLDNNFDSSLGSLDAISSCYDSLVEYEGISDKTNSHILRENIKFHKSEPGGFKLVGKLAKSWALHSNMQTITFNLREGVKSHWGNELKAYDVKWSWERKLILGGIGGFFASLIGLNNSDQIQIDNNYTVTFKLDKPASLILKVHRNPRNYIYDSKKIKDSTNDDDPWGKKWISENIAGFGPYKMISLESGKKFIADRHKNYWGKKPSIDRLIM
jgi:ABC-type dipeptide transport system, periplasmic component